MKSNSKSIKYQRMQLKEKNKLVKEISKIIILKDKIKKNIKKNLGTQVD